jgi:lactate dehydrogenase-like 2-hydroxyacid dehydrogenase
VIVRPEILLMRAIYASTIAELEREFTVHKLWTAPDPHAYIKSACANVRAAVTTPPAGFSRRDFEALPKLEILACFGPHCELLDLAAAKERGVSVTYTPDSTAEPVADLAMGMIVAVMRRLCEADRFVRAGKWPAGVFVSGREVRGNTCGIVGFGRIGREIAKRAAAFDMSVCYYGPRRKENAAYPYFDDLETMARHSDCLVVTCPATPATRNLVDARILGALGADGFLVNVARGTIVDEQALIAALAGKQIAGAALDVFQDEPRVPAALMQMDNVVLAPHIGTSTRENREERARKLMLNLHAHFAGKPLIHAVAA